MSDGSSIAVGLAVLAPLAAAVLTLVLAGGPGERIAPGVLLAAGAGGAVAAAVASSGGGEVWRGFVADPWRAALAAAVCLAAAAALGDERAGDRGPLGRAAGATAAGLVVASLLAPNVLWLGLALAASTGALAVVGLASTEVGEVARIRVLRAAAAVLVADILALIALAEAGHRGFSLPPSAAGGEWLVAIAAAIRLGCLPAATEAAFGSQPVARAFVGGVRAQGALLAGLVAAAGGSPARGLAGIGAAAALIGTLRVLRAGSPSGMATAQGGLVAIGFGLGGSAGALGAVLVLGASFAAWPLALSGRVPSAARLGLAGGPAGAGLAGGALVSGAALQAGAARPGYLLLALPALVAAAGGAVGAWRMRPAAAPRRAVADALWVLPLVGALGVLVAIPARALEGFATRAVATFGFGRPLGAEPLALGEDLGIALAIAAVLGLVAAAGRGEPEPAPEPAPEPLWPAPVGRWRAIAVVLGAGSAGLAVWLYFLAARNGFL